MLFGPFCGMSDARLHVFLLSRLIFAQCPYLLSAPETKNGDMLCEKL